MEWIRISDSKLKVVMDEADMSRYDIRADSMNYHTTETRRAVWQILDEAKQKTGFNAASDRVLIQAYPSRGGGCELYITKILPLDGAVPPSLPDDREGRHPVAYVFSGMEDLLAACRRLREAGYHGGSSAYETEDGADYLFLWEQQEREMPPCWVAEEYGERADGSESRLSYIKEHALCLVPGDAVSRLASLA